MKGFLPSKHFINQNLLNREVSLPAAHMLGLKTAQLFSHGLSLSLLNKVPKDNQITKPTLI